MNVIANFYGGQKENLLKFHEFYYQTLEEWSKKNIHIGREENIMYYIIWKYPEVAILIGRRYQLNGNHDFLKMLLKKN